MTAERRDLMASLHRSLTGQFGDSLYGMSIPEDLASSTASLTLTFVDGDKGVLARQQLLTHPNLPLQVGDQSVMVPLSSSIRTATTAGVYSLLLIHHPGLGDFAREGAAAAIFAACEGLQGIPIVAEFLSQTGKYTKGASPGLPDT